MTFTVIVTRNVESRVRGFLASCLLELASGVYTAPVMSPAVRERVWAVLVKWKVGARGDSAVMTWAEPGEPCGQAVRTLGEPVLQLFDADGIVLARRPLSDEEARSLAIELEEVPF